MNRLGSEKSPYLLQHAYNPVDWWPWCEEAFERAKTEDKPVFLSIGYSTCHWCHVMARESFEDGDVAALLNRDYLCVKVDREERPDVDAAYMAACQMFNGSGGWPLTVIMTPDQKPFWTGTYLPKTAAYGRMGLTELLEAVSRLWETDRGALLSRGMQAAALLKERHGAPVMPAEPDRALLSKAVGQFESGYDPKWGGFSPAPKFPTPHNLLFLMRYSLLEKDGDSLEMALHTLRAMFRGGIFDHIGGGFSRYSTDEKWLAPHFEKMLYDNALLALAYLEAYGITKDELFKTVAERTLDYVIRELKDGEGGFYCGQDADSDGVEGKYYLFTDREIRDVLGEEDGKYFCGWFGVQEVGNFEGKNILNLLENPEYAKDNARIGALSDTMYAYRKNRVQLHTDDKVLTSWNALMITALARAGWLLEKPGYIQAAKGAQRFIETALTDENGALMLRWREGEAAHSGQLDDHAFYAYALLELHRRTGEVVYLRQAIRIAQVMTELFSDPEQGGLFLYSKDGEQLISRPKETYDGAIPSGNGVAALVFERLSKLTGEEKWREASRRQLRFLAGAAREYPAGHSATLLAAGEALSPSFELVCATPEARIPRELDAFLRETPLPGLTLLLKTPENAAELEICAPFTAGYPIPERGAAYYLCHDGTCRPPVFDIAAMAAIIEELSG